MAKKPAVSWLDFIKFFVLNYLLFYNRSITGTLKEPYSMLDSSTVHIAFSVFSACLFLQKKE